MQDECIEMVKPGTIFLDIHLHAIAVATAGLLKLGLLVDGTYEEIYKSRAAVAFFSHGVSNRANKCNAVTNVFSWVISWVSKYTT
jgi:Xaa-Pro dipeptidase